MERDFSLNASSFNLGWVGLGWVVPVVNKENVFTYFLWNQRN